MRRRTARLTCGIGIGVLAGLGLVGAGAGAQRAGDDSVAPVVRLTPQVLDQAPRMVPPPPAPAAADSAAGSNLEVYLLTVGPGGEVWQRFGHNAIRIRNRATGMDTAYNWGTFDFNQPNFLTRFLTGNTEYWMVGNDAVDDIQKYIAENRSVWVQQLALTPAQRVALAQFVVWNEREENRYYRYDYYLDNCSTRVRDALDRVLGGALRRAFMPRGTGTTYRSHTRRLTDGDAAVYTGIQLALGRRADSELSAWDESFLPVKLMEHVRDIRVPGAQGALVPLVSAERQIYEAQRPPEPDRPPSHLLAYLVAGAIVGGLLALFGRGAAAGRRGAAPALGVVAGLWVLLTGLLGTAVLLAGTVTRHVFMGRNVNLAAYSPIALIALGVIVAALGARPPASRARWIGRAERVTGLIAALSVVGVLVALAIGQRSGETFALAVPANVGLWWAFHSLASARRA